MVFTSAAFDYPEISANAFENVEQGMPKSPKSLDVLVHPFFQVDAAHI